MPWTLGGAVCRSASQVCWGIRDEEETSRDGRCPSPGQANKEEGGYALRAWDMASRRELGLLQDGGEEEGLTGRRWQGSRTAARGRRSGRGLGSPWKVKRKQIRPHL